MDSGSRLVIADDHVLFRQGIQALLRDYPDLQVVGEASNGLEALEKCRALRPDVVLVDAELPSAHPSAHPASHPPSARNGSSGRPDSRLVGVGEGVEVTRGLRAELPETKVVLLSSQTERSELVYEAIRAGALGFVTKTSEIGELVSAIRAVAKGQAGIAVGSLTNLVTILGSSRGSREAEETLEETLSEREEEVLELVAQGQSNREIALTLFISESTVRSHLHNILDKLQLSNRVQAAKYALTTRRRRPSPSVSRKSGGARPDPRSDLPTLWQRVGDDGASEIKGTQRLGGLKGMNGANGVKAVPLSQKQVS